MYQCISLYQISAKIAYTFFVPALKEVVTGQTYSCRSLIASHLSWAEVQTIPLEALFESTVFESGDT